MGRDVENGRGMPPKKNPISSALALGRAINGLRGLGWVYGVLAAGGSLPVLTALLREQWDALPPVGRAGAILAVIALVFLVVGWVRSWWWGRNSRPTALVVDYEMLPNPVDGVPPGKRVLPLLKLRLDGPDDPVVYSGTFEFKYGQWPNVQYRGTVRNLGDANLLAIELPYDATFFSGPPFHSPVVGTRRFRVTVPVLAVGETFSFVLASASDHAISVQLPVAASLRVYGEEQSQTAQVIRSQESNIADLANLLFSPRKPPPPQP
jgi:hypothetical protein